MTVRKPAIPALSGISDRATHQVLSPIKETLEIITGQRIAPLKFLPLEAAGTSVVSKLNEVIARLNVSGSGEYEDTSQTSGSGGTSAGVTTTYADITMTKDTPNKRVELLSTPSGGYNVGAGEMRVEFDITFANFLTLNPSAHFATVLRCDMGLISSAVMGNGMIFGYFAGAPEAPVYSPTTIIETWMGTYTLVNRLIPGSEGYADKLLQDNVKYRVVISSIVKATGARYVRYKLYRENVAKESFDLERDTGDVLDMNHHFNAQNTGLAFGFVFDAGVAGWSINIQGLKVTWLPADEQTRTHNPTWATGTGISALAGNLAFIGDGAKLIIDSNNATLTKRFTVQDKTTNGGTNLYVIPNGTSTDSGFVALNASNLAGAWRYVKLGMSGNNAVVELFQGNGATTPSLLFKYNGTEKMRIEADGLKMAGASKYIGKDSTYLTGMSNLADPDAYNLTQAAFDFNNVTAAGQIAAYLGGTYNTGTLETVIRPLYCFMSCLLADLRERKVL